MEEEQLTTLSPLIPSRVFWLFLCSVLPLLTRVVRLLIAARLSSSVITLDVRQLLPFGIIDLQCVSVIAVELVFFVKCSVCCWLFKCWNFGNAVSQSWNDHLCLLIADLLFSVDNIWVHWGSGFYKMALSKCVCRSILTSAFVDFAVAVFVRMPART